MNVRRIAATVSLCILVELVATSTQVLAQDPFFPEVQVQRTQDEAAEMQQYIRNSYFDTGAETHAVDGAPPLLVVPPPEEWIEEPYVYATLNSEGAEFSERVDGISFETEDEMPSDAQPLIEEPYNSYATMNSEEATSFLDSIVNNIVSTLLNAIPQKQTLAYPTSTSSETMLMQTEPGFAGQDGGLPMPDRLDSMMTVSSWEERPMVSSNDLFRQLSLVRFAPICTRFRVFVVPLDTTADNEPSMADLVQALLEDDFIGSNGADTFEGSITYTTDIYDTIVSNEDVYADVLETDATYEYEPYASTEYTTFDQVFDLTGFPQASRTGYTQDYDEVLNAYDDAYGDYHTDGADYDIESDYDTSYFIANNDDNVFTNNDMMRSNFLEMKERYSDENDFSSEPFGIGDDEETFAEWLRNGGWRTVLLCIACACVWAAVLIEYKRATVASALYCGPGDKPSNIPKHGLLSSPLLEEQDKLQGEFDGVESANMNHVYSIKVQHASRVQQEPENELKLKAYSPV